MKITKLRTEVVHLPFGSAIPNEGLREPENAMVKFPPELAREQIFG